MNEEAIEFILNPPILVWMRELPNWMSPGSRIAGAIRKPNLSWQVRGLLGEWPPAPLKHPK